MYFNTWRRAFEEKKEMTHDGPCNHCGANVIRGNIKLVDNLLYCLNCSERIYKTKAIFIYSGTRRIGKRVGNGKAIRVIGNMAEDTQ